MALTCSELWEELHAACRSLIHRTKCGNSLTCHIPISFLWQLFCAQYIHRPLVLAYCLINRLHNDCRKMSCACNSTTITQLSSIYMRQSAFILNFLQQITCLMYHVLDVSMRTFNNNKTLLCVIFMLQCMNLSRDIIDSRLKVPFYMTGSK